MPGGKETSECISANILSQKQNPPISDKNKLTPQQVELIIGRWQEALSKLCQDDYCPQDYLTSSKLVEL